MRQNWSQWRRGQPFGRAAGRERRLRNSPGSFAGGSTLTTNINGGREWGNGQTHVALLKLPAAGLPVKDIRSATITAHFGGGIGGGNWNVQRIQLMATLK